LPARIVNTAAPGGEDHHAIARVEDLIDPRMRHRMLLLGGLLLGGSADCFQTALDPFRCVDLDLRGKQREK